MFIMNCATCGEEFETNVKTAKFCSTHCNFLYDYEHKEPLKTCINCGKKFHFENQKIDVCSKECSIKHHSKHVPNTYKEGVYNYSCTCVICGINFKSPSKKKYCSLDCEFFKRDVFAKKTFKRICTNCGKEFESERERVSVCSDECKHERSHGAEKVKKTRESLIKKFGGDYGKVLADKAKQTIIEKYGVDNYNKTEEAKEKIKKTCLEKYGKESYLQTDEAKEKRRKFFIENYGVDTCNTSEVPEIKNKISDSHKKRVELGLLHNYSHIENFDKYNDLDFIKSKFINDKNEFLMKEFCEFFNLTLTGATTRKINLGLRNYPNANSRIKTQLAIYNWIKSFYDGNVLSNNKTVIKPLELDIYIPEFKLAIEYNGLMFHSFGKSKHAMFDNYLDEFVEKHHLLEKTEICESNGIKVFQIFENEWIDRDKQEIWKSMIKVNLNKADTIINARDCEIIKVNQKDCNEFLQKNHLQGPINSSIAYGLYYNNELVQLLTFGKSRFNKSYTYELLRQCTKTYTVVRGGFSKLLKHFKSKYDGSIISYGNRRWTCFFSNTYGDKPLNTSPPNYFYFNDYYNPILYSRQKFQKHKLKDELENFDNSKTETENMYDNGYRRVYDCGNLSFEL